MSHRLPVYLLLCFITPIITADLQNDLANCQTQYNELRARWQYLKNSHSQLQRDLNEEKRLHTISEEKRNRIIASMNQCQQDLNEQKSLYKTLEERWNGLKNDLNQCQQELNASRTQQ